MRLLVHTALRLQNFSSALDNICKYNNILSFISLNHSVNIDLHGESALQTSFITAGLAGDVVLLLRPAARHQGAAVQLPEVEGLGEHRVLPLLLHRGDDVQHLVWSLGGHHFSSAPALYHYYAAIIFLSNLMQ